MIRSVAMALPTYTFSSFDVPIAVCDKMDSSIHCFWWKPKSDSGRYLAWKAWANLCVPKINSGLGFRGAKRFNDALLTKLTCLVVSGHDGPCMNTLRSKYKVCGGWINSEPKKFASSTWRAIE